MHTEFHEVAYCEELRGAAPVHYRHATHLI